MKYKTYSNDDVAMITKICYSEYISIDSLFVSSFWASSRLSKMSKKK